jgi:hypothetical protein
VRRAVDHFVNRRFNMNRTSKALTQLAATAILCTVAQTASAVTLTAPNTCSTAPYCGASFLSGQWNKSAGAIWEEQYFLVDVAAGTLLHSTNEHLAMSAFAHSQPFNASNSWVGPPHGAGPAPNGGIGVAFGTISSGSWPTCPSDPTNAYAEIAIERFGYQGTGGTQILDCAQVSKATLSGAKTLRVEFYASCVFGSCSASATLSNPSTSQVYAQLSQGAISLQNPTAERDIWYGFLNASTPSVSASYTVIGESYSSAP